METNHGTPQPVLSEREIEILKLVCTGASNQQIAHDLVISVNTVKVHLRNIFGKLGVESRTEATLYAIRQGWVAVETPPAALEAVEELPPRERIASWQRVVLVLTAVFIALVVFMPPVRTVSNGTGGPFSDRTVAAPSTPSGAVTSRWTGKAQLPTARARLAVVSHAGKIYAIAGDSEEGVSGVVEAYDPLTDIWVRLTSKPKPVRNVGAAVLNGRIYVPGGYDAMDQAITTVEVYDPGADAWSEAAPLPTPLFAYALATVQGKLYLFGGSDGMRYLDAVWIYDPARDSWTGGTPMREPRGFCAAAVLHDQVYVMGGYDGADESALCYVYDPAKEGSGQDPWTQRASLHQARGGLAALAAEGYVYAIGGGWTQPLSNSERYDAEQDKWLSFDSPVLGQWRTLGAASISAVDATVIYAVGGWSDRYLGVNYAYRTFFRIYMPGI